MKRKWINKGEVVIIIALLFTAVLCLFFINRQDGAAAEIIADGKLVRVLDLDKNGFFSIDERPGVMFEIMDGAVCFAESNCPDKICVRTGFINKAGQTAVCLPNRTVIKVINGDDDDLIDAVTW